MGHSHPHGLGRRRPQRRKQKDDPRLLCIRRQLIEIKSDLDTTRNQKEHENELLRNHLKQRDDRIARLEILISALLEAQPAFRRVPDHVHRMIELDAPSALKRSTLGSSINLGYKRPTHENALDALHLVDYHPTDDTFVDCEGFVPQPNDEMNVLPQWL